jgi:hypothetical protein
MFLYQDKVSAISSSVAEINFMMISSRSYVVLENNINYILGPHLTA